MKLLFFIILIFCFTIRADHLKPLSTDFYKDNTLTTRWTKDMEVPMDLRSEKEWKNMFRKIGFSTTVKHVLDTKNKSKWKREFGTLFVIGKKL